MYQLELSKEAIKDFKKMDKNEAKILYHKMKKDLHGIKDPRANGKALQGELSQLWRYRFGNYRVVVKINDSTMVILAITIGHRNSIYK